MYASVPMLLWSDGSAQWGVNYPPLQGCTCVDTEQFLGDFLERDVLGQEEKQELSRQHLHEAN